MSFRAPAIALMWHWTFWSALTIYGLACIGTGLLSFRLLAGPRAAENHSSAALYLVLAGVFGLGALGHAWMLLALGGLFIRPLVYPALALLLATAIVLGWQQWRALAGEFRELRASLRRERWGMRVLLFAALAAMVYTFTSLGRELTGDSLALHLMIPKLVAAAGTLERNWFQPGNEDFGILGEMTYAAVMLIGNADAAQMVTWPLFLAMAAVLIGICGRTGIGLRGKIVALAAVASSTAATIWVGDGKIDIIASTLGLASLYFLLPRPDLSPLPRSNLMIAGLLAGFAVTAKLILGFCLVLASAVLLLWTYAPAAVEWRRPSVRLITRSLMPLISAGLLFGVFALIGLAPHFIKNGVLLGAPFAPLGTENTGWLVRERWYDAETVTRIRLLYPFVLTFGDYWAQYGHLSVLVLAFLPLAFFLGRPDSFRRSPLTGVTVAAWVTIAGWATFQGDKVVMRYMLPVLLLCIPLAAAAAEQVTARWFRPRFLGTALIVAGVTTLYITANFSTGRYFFPHKAVRVMFGLQEPCERSLQWCMPMYMVSRLAPEGARVFAASSFKYDLRPDLIQCSYDHRHVAFPGATAEERWRWFYAQGYSFIIPDAPGNPAHLLSDLSNPPPWIKVTRYQPNNPDGPISISYDLAQGGPTAPPEIACRRSGRRNFWKIVRTNQ